MKDKIEKLEEQSFNESDSPELPPPDIIAYNELRSCADLYRMATHGILEIQPEFQREIVWKNPDQTRFIDSLIKHLPIPSMCFSLDYKTQKWQVIDGLQRMATIIKFLSGKEWVLSKLDDVDDNLVGQNVAQFTNENSKFNKFYTSVENLTLPITVLRCDYSKKSHTNYLFMIFHRLNTLGMKLNNQEIRNCIYAGTFNKMLKKLNQEPAWKKLNRMKMDIGYRFTKQELILRLFAFHDDYNKYRGRLARFLNEYMDGHKDLDEGESLKKAKLFKRTIDIAYVKLFNGKMSSKISITVLETLLFGISHNLKYLESIPAKCVKNLYKQLLAHEELSDKKLSEGLSGKTRVMGRLVASKNIFSGRKSD